ncbi:hypothetical protein Vretifemale_20188 [Volvox reticuliferus]|uniref:Uncharacterized protein n=1 Tax=Volvox reticuliferus TaxID=1737510 RepID=A0A8J4D309_9CHLO|nr:hypothetical protein Vretifemale_20188 [Volvox reticuliferus]
MPLQSRSSWHLLRSLESSGSFAVDDKQADGGLCIRPAGSRPCRLPVRTSTSSSLRRSAGQYELQPPPAAMPFATTPTAAPSVASNVPSMVSLRVEEQYA